MCKIKTDQFPLDYLDITLPDTPYIPYKYDGWENVKKFVRQQEYCMSNSYIGTFYPSNKFSCNYNNMKLAVSGFFEFYSETKEKKVYKLTQSYLQDDKFYGTADSTLTIKDKYNNTHWNAEIVFQLDTLIDFDWEVRLFPTIATNLDDEDFYFVIDQAYKINKDVCNYTDDNNNGVKLLLTRILFILIAFLF